MSWSICFYQVCLKNSPLTKGVRGIHYALFKGEEHRSARGIKQTSFLKMPALDFLGFEAVAVVELGFHPVV